MKVKEKKIAIKSDEDVYKEVKRVWQAIEKDEDIDSHEGIYFKNMEVMKEVLTDERLKMIRTIKKDNPMSINELARLLERDYRQTNEDVEYLAQMGLIEIEYSVPDNDKIVAHVSYDRILLEIPV
ncbi:MAG: hypothetical protein L3V56_10120 [Candidatus Magnetoovum sp. WYHC-5]|nr:hypothetical protein [Candidatus Magnetoovum sp. WYHC-5]